jgi:hypothetical protein
MPDTEVRCGFCHPDDPLATGCCEACRQVLADYIRELVQDRDVRRAVRTALIDESPLDTWDARLVWCGAVIRPAKEKRASR